MNKYIAMYTAERVEHAITANQPLQGLVLDIIKCYNAVPRIPLYALLRRLGVPDPIVQAFSHAMMSIERFFVIAGTCSTTFATTTGIAEGCSIAVPSMLALSILADNAIKKTNATTQTAMFADNWALFDPETPMLMNAFRALKDVLDALRFEIAGKNSWFWASHPSARRQLKQRAKATGIPVVLHAKDLGIQQNYGKRLYKETTKKKVKKTIQRLHKVKKLRANKKTKQRIAVGSGLSCLQYGAQTLQLAKHELTKLRTATTQAVGVRGSGVNPKLACNVARRIDPEYRIIWYAVHSWKRYFQLFPDRLQAWATTPISRAPNRRTHIGPIANLANQLQKIGWQVTLTNTEIQLATQWGTVDVLVCPTTLTKQLFDEAWNAHIAQSIARKDYQPTSWDTQMQNNALKKRTARERGILDAFMAGKNLTSDMKAKYLDTYNGKCPMCEEWDSKEHRLEKCERLLHVREKHHNTLHAVRAWTPTQKHFGIAPVITIDYRDHIQYATKPMPVDDPQQSDGRSHVFCDGTTYFGNTVQLAIAGYAIVEAQPLEDNFRLIKRARVCRLPQNSYAGEVMAVLEALNAFHKVTIYSDCQAVVQQLQQILDAPHETPQKKGGQYNAAWQAIHAHVRRRNPEDIVVHKVKAHQDPTLVADPDKRWKAQGNQCADYHAKKAVIEDAVAVYRRREQSAERLKSQLDDLVKYHQYLVDIQTEVLKVEQQKKKREQKVAEWVPPCPEAHIELSPSLDAAKRCPYGAEFCWRVVYWASQLQWCDERCPRCQATGPDEPNDVSYLELYIDFRLFTHADAPINVTTPAERVTYKIPRYELRDKNTCADDKGNPQLAVQSRTWICFVKWAQSQQMGLFHASHKSRARSAAKFGYARLLQGLDRRPVLTKGSQAFQYLLQYFRASSGPNKNLDKVLDIPATAAKLPQCPPEYRLTYQEVAQNCKNHQIRLHTEPTN